MKKLLLLSLFGFLVSPMAAFAANPVFEVSPNPIYLNETFTLTCADLGTQGNQFIVAVIYTPELDPDSNFIECAGAEDDMNSHLLDVGLEGVFTVVLYDDNLLTSDNSYLSVTNGPEFISQNTFEMINSERP